MTPVKLDNGFSFAIEPCEKLMRVVVFKNGVENVCRRETFKNLERFTRSHGERIFKGRLQLHKNSEEIIIEVKGKIAGKMTPDDFTSYLEKVKNTSNKSIDQR